MRRAGELLNEIEPQPGVRSDLEPEAGVRPRLTRTAAASGAGFSPHQAKQAVRVANVPRQDFERQIESPKPPTIAKTRLIPA